MRTKLPQVENLQENVFDEEMRDKDVYLKYRNKLYVDEKRGAVDCDLETGDGNSVLLKKAVKDKMDRAIYFEIYSEQIIVSADTGDEGQPSVREPIARKPTEPVLRRSTRVKTVPQHFKDFKM
uniref:Uncharacterized protein n=1 Tax=Magallana gigas TaxID=29159 RepID=A0A8W8I3R2_MAGGI